MSHWKLNETEGTTASDSVGDNNGTVSGASWTSSGQIGYALEFDGSSDYVTVGDQSDLELQDFTLSFWAKLDSSSGSLDGGVAKGYVFGSPSEYSYTLNFHNGSAGAYVTCDDVNHHGVTASIGDTNWHMWTMTAGAGVVTLYKDGAYEDEVTYSGSIDYDKSNNNFVIGARDNGSFSLGRKGVRLHYGVIVL